MEKLSLGLWYILSTGSGMENFDFISIVKKSLVPFASANEALVSGNGHTFLLGNGQKRKEIGYSDGRTMDGVLVTIDQESHGLLQNRRGENDPSVSDFSI